MKVTFEIEVDTDNYNLASRVANAIIDFGYDSFDPEVFGLADDDAVSVSRVTEDA